MQDDCSGRIENSVTRDNSSASLGKPHDAEQLPSCPHLILISLVILHAFDKVCNPVGDGWVSGCVGAAGRGGHSILEWVSMCVRKSE